MRARFLAAATIAAGLALAPTAAGAKGAKEMTVAGPGLAAPIRLANTADAASSPIDIALKSGLLSQKPNRLSSTRPSDRLGPRYVATYQWLVGPDKTVPLRQELYPFADAGALSYTAPRQRVLDVPTRGGWYRAGPALTLLLVAAGVPVPVACQPPRACGAGPPGRSDRAPSRG
jgi:hypothetical protein